MHTRVGLRRNYLYFRANKYSASKKSAQKHSWEKKSEKMVDLLVDSTHKKQFEIFANKFVFTENPSENE